MASPARSPRARRQPSALPLRGRSAARCCLIACAVAWAAACGGGPAPDATAADPARAVAAPLLPPEPDGAAVARVNGAPISRARFEAALRRAPAGTPPAQVLRALIDLELLTQAAQAQGLDARPEAADLRDHALIQRLLEDEVERPVSLASLPPDLPKQAYDSFAFDLFEPELLTTSHALIELPEAAQTPARLAAAMAAAQAIHDHLAPRPSASPPTPMDVNRAAALQNLFGWTVRAEHGVTFPLTPVPPLPGSAPRFPAVVEPFAAAAARLSAAAPLSPPTATSFGAHVILLTERSPDLRPAFAPARDDIAQKLVLAQRRVTTARLLERLSAPPAEVRLNDAPLDALAARLSGRAPSPP